MSKRAGEMLKEEMEVLGAVRLRDVEKAQQEVVAIARKLEEEGVIVDRRRRGRGVCRLGPAASTVATATSVTPWLEAWPTARCRQRPARGAASSRGGAGRRRRSAPRHAGQAPAARSSEREAFAKGFAQGERAGAAAAQAQSAALAPGAGRARSTS